MPDQWDTPVDPIVDELITAEWGTTVATDLRVLFAGVPTWVASPSGDLSQNYGAAANTAIGFPFTCRDAATISGLSWTLDTANGNVDVGIYEDDDNGTTCSKLKTNGGEPCPTGAGVKTTLFSAPQALTPYQKYWLWFSSNHASFRMKGTNGPSVVIFRKMASAYPLPTVITFASAGTITPAFFAELT